ncbi:metallophosphoesterase [Deinococcus soli (ex Cha et al. 2016)]|uniref:metallophosphoesterase n=1 Tax=Deinococcus soli (ex Cha et al. 2016) TaxID=1309411 RepID=UPI0016636855|nr:metallophosphoesterase [Deinococcus soli (ex Cha et al. 2016)]GGB69194.1 hypothetical protein GCM10008019_26730 [Deinococcus soli (ex Cha et al. 2016)]
MTNAPIVVPDLHGRADLLTALLATHPGRRFVFLGDLVDRGPDAPGVIAQIRPLVERGQAVLLWGNHDHMLAHALCYEDGEPRPRSHAQLGVRHPETLAQWPTLQAAQQDMAWLFTHAAHWHREGDVYFAHAAPHKAGNWGADESPHHLWARPDDEFQDGRAPLPTGCTRAFHGHTPTRLLRPDGADEPFQMTWEDGTTAHYLDCLAWATNVLVAHDLLTGQLTKVGGRLLSNTILS